MTWWGVYNNYENLKLSYRRNKSYIYCNKWNTVPKPTTFSAAFNKVLFSIRFIAFSRKQLFDNFSYGWPQNPSWIIKCTFTQKSESFIESQYMKQHNKLRRAFKTDILMIWHQRPCNNNIMDRTQILGNFPGNGFHLVWSWCHKVSTNIEKTLQNPGITIMDKLYMIFNQLFQSFLWKKKKKTVQKE